MASGGCLFLARGSTRRPGGSNDYPSRFCEGAVVTQDPLSDSPGEIPEVPLTTEASALLGQIRSRIQDRLLEVSRVPVGVLIWGPGLQSTHPLVPVRLALRDTLRHCGHAAAFSEELCEAGSLHSLRLQQLVQALEVDLIVSLPCTPGAIAEIHDFAADRRVNTKTMVFLNSSYVDGYAGRSLRASPSTHACRIEYYPSERETSIILDVVRREAERIRESKCVRAGLL